MLEEERKKRKQFQDLGRKMLGLFFHLVYPLDTGQGRGNESTVSPRTLPRRTEDGGQSRRCHRPRVVVFPHAPSALIFALVSVVWVPSFPLLSSCTEPSAVLVPLACRGPSGTGTSGTQREDGAGDQRQRG